MGIQEDTGAYRGIEGDTEGYRRIKELTGEYRGYRQIQEVTRVYRRIKGGYRGIQVYIPQYQGAYHRNQTPNTYIQGRRMQGI